MRIPYIGITDFLTYEQVQNMLAVFNTHLAPEQQRRLHVGVMMSYKTLNNIETKWTQAFPPKETIASIFGSQETMNCLHYADYENIDVSENLTKAISYGGEGMNALQLDMVWPDYNQVVKAVESAGKPLEVILQIGKNAIEQANNDPLEVMYRVCNYQGIVDHVLLDKSMGRGLGMDAEGLIPFAEAINTALPNIGLSAAGGLGSTTVHLVEPLAKVFPSISIDAQGKLRPSGNALDPVDWSMAAEYLIQALKLLR